MGVGIGVAIEVAAVVCSCLIYRRGLRRVTVDIRLGREEHHAGFTTIESKLDVIEEEMGKAMERFGLRRPRM
jgi:hypothetical protein